MHKSSAAGSPRLYQPVGKGVQGDIGVIMSQEIESHFASPQSSTIIRHWGQYGVGARPPARGCTGGQRQSQRPFGVCARPKVAPNHGRRLRENPSLAQPASQPAHWHASVNTSNCSTDDPLTGVGSASSLRRYDDEDGPRTLKTLSNPPQAPMTPCWVSSRRQSSLLRSETSRAFAHAPPSYLSRFRLALMHLTCSR